MEPVSAKNDLARARRRLKSAAWLLGAILVAAIAVGAKLLPEAFDPVPTAAPTASPSPEVSASPSADPSRTPDQGSFPTPVPSGGPAPATGPASAALETLEVKGRAPKTGYERTVVFGKAWLDVDRNGCDTRNDILARDLTDTARLKNCKVASGVLRDPYSGDTIAFERGPQTSPLVQIDHVVALSDAWQKGAQQLTQAQREALANDPLNLLAVSGAQNSSKEASDAASWLPPRSEARCAYVARQIAVKAKYALWVTDAERNAMRVVLDRCPAEPLPAG
ncbi:hypothetical protein BMH32_07890 [Leucobacter sp. OLJS4]|nr:hypothetical protein BMH25_10565 [Leucobacter sp. OLCALW19]PII87499.1 hypothetical protein BMH26_10240 [Leucobacter sp. OLTLW20]PII94443.1 hypothetical protein BMH27_00160 [Leucobacter sp. OLAS13]PIJ00757.1 hypothetical protein BMH29_01355 [Leucobacter sp. OLDS2]PIJ00816.1 hypothetical protein BMH28_08685 [Leucobacter sp. OLCS4]PIJ03391.1 hypothetical protein BMH31_07935 [Leucobacter sp. OLIS6]PIJ11126.1 hypothetical protein BMH32_07890 [Leucobacter sp. OLJS4]PIJ51743.1 hypothetical prote